MPSKPKVRRWWAVMDRISGEVSGELYPDDEFLGAQYRVRQFPASYYLARVTATPVTVDSTKRKKRKGSK